MFLRKSGIGAAVAAITAFAANPAAALPVEWGLGFQGAASPVMEQIESFHTLLLWIIVATCLFVLGLLVWIVIRYRAAANPVPSKVHHNTLLEVAWTLIPVIILVFIAVPSFRLLYFQETLPKPDVQIKAIGKQWFWTYEYPGSAAGFTFDSLMLSDADAAKAGKPRLLAVDNAIYVPVNKVIEVETSGADVIHSFAMPEMGVKMDAVPGRLTTLWFEATTPGEYHIFCAEYCGTKHSGMIGKVIAMTPQDYQAWLAGGRSTGTAAQNGERLFADLACNTCHKPDATGRGPSLHGLFGNTVELADGRKVVADDNYLRESIMNSQAKVVKGYQGIMPAFQGMVSEENLMQLIAYIRTLKPAQPAPDAAGK